MRISVFGLGKLGAPWAAVLGSKGHTVIGVDVNRQFVDAINQGMPPVAETDLDRFISEARGRLSATADGYKAVLETDVTFVIVATPSNDQGVFSMEYVQRTAEPIGRALKDKDGYHLVVLTSTVMPGDTDASLRHALEKHSGKRCGRDFGLCYSPEFIALGSVIRDMLHPDFILIGESDPRAGEMLSEIYLSVCNTKPPIARMNFVNAEITKLAVNTFVTTKISYANMLARVCEHVAGADVDVVTGALGLDSRIGRKYLKGAVSYGGPCFPRDNIAFAALARRLGVRALLAEATDQTNRQHVASLAETVIANLPEGGCAGILGLSYKPNTNVCTASAGLELAHQLLKKEVRLTVYDPQAMDNARRELGDGLTYASSAAECARKADVLVVTVPWDEFRQISAQDLRRARSAGKPTVIDCWRVLDRKQIQSAANLIILGMGMSEGADKREGISVTVNVAKGPLQPAGR